MNNKAAFMTGLHSIEIRDTEVPKPKDDEVLVRIEYVGICGSDVHFYETGKIGDFIVEPPFILGHETAGVVEEVGSNVKDLKAGDKVALEPGVPCGICQSCRSGWYNLCPQVVFMAAPPYHGALTKYLTHSAAFSFKLPNNVSTMEGALIEPLAVGLHAAGQVGVALGDSVTILGAGCIGLVSLLAAKASGAGRVYISDIEDKRLSFAKKLGATETINAKEVDTIEKIGALTEGHGTDKVIECAGSPVTIAQTPHLVSRSGTIVLVGMSLQDEINYNLMQLILKEASITTVFRYRNKYPVAIEAIASGAIKIKDIVTHTFDFEDTKKAFDFVIENPSDVVKAVIKVS
jgi:L-iditol 2-dehydrogenase